MNEAIRPTAAQPMFNPLSPDFIRDPYPFYAHLRQTDPMYMTPLKAYLASHNADVAMILRDRRFGKDFTGRTVARYGPSIMEEPVFRSMSHWMLTQDPAGPHAAARPGGQGVHGAADR